MWSGKNKPKGKHLSTWVNCGCSFLVVCHYCSNAGQVLTSSLWQAPICCLCNWAGSIVRVFEKATGATSPLPSSWSRDLALTSGSHLIFTFSIRTTCYPSPIHWIDSPFPLMCINAFHQYSGNFICLPNNGSSGWPNGCYTPNWVLFLPWLNCQEQVSKFAGIDI